VGQWSDIAAADPASGPPTDGISAPATAPAAQRTFLVRLKDNRTDWDCGYAGLEVLADGTFVSTTYGTWTTGEKPYVMSVRFTLKELDERAPIRE
jgi:hypothetical protein